MMPARKWLSWLMVAGCSYDFGGQDAGSGAADDTGSQTSTSSPSASSAGGGAPSTSALVGSTSHASTGSDGTGGAAPDPLRDCRAVRDADPGAPDGRYQIDPDEEGGHPPFVVACAMTIEGGGWTRFNWVGAPIADKKDPLAKHLFDCDAADVSCPGRIPASAMPTELLVVDLTDGEYGVWTFDPANAMSNAVLGALRDHAKVCIHDETAWDPDVETSTEEFCFDQPGGCNSFQYGDMCESDQWVLQLDDDNHTRMSAFKIGSTTSSPGGPCADVDWGYLDDDGCAEEFGALYYR